MKNKTIILSAISDLANMEEKPILAEYEFVPRPPVPEFFLDRKKKDYVPPHVKPKRRFK